MQPVYNGAYPFWAGPAGDPATRRNVYYQTRPGKLIEQTLESGEGTLTDTGALVIRTGRFTGRSPLDRFIVSDAYTAGAVDWNGINQPMPAECFDRLHERIVRHLSEKEVWVRDCYVCDDERYRSGVRVVTEKPWASLFCHNMLLRPRPEELDDFKPALTVLHAPGCFADPLTDCTRQGNFAVLDLTRGIILIGGTSYTGEIKKGIFSMLNYLLAAEHGVLGMHCAANTGPGGDTALFFGLSGTGKTTLSADPERSLIGDDEHGWGDEGVFNFEGGCYAKCINLCPEKEPQIYGAIRRGALMENVRFFEGTGRVNYADKSITENTRVSYPIDFVENTVHPSRGGAPANIFFLTCDAWGVLPPVARLTPSQAMYQFLSGYTAKVAGTETGITEPKATFSACYGAPFLPLHPARYAAMLGRRIRAAGVSCWLVNTGWTGGAYGTGERISLSHTRSIIRAALDGSLKRESFRTDPLFGFSIPLACPGVPDGVLFPRDSWGDKKAFDAQARQLAVLFEENFRKFEGMAPEEVRNAGPVLQRTP
jgi:phosphoenolpyruvate carboxykinase (ATP)